MCDELNLNVSGFKIVSGERLNNHSNAYVFQIFKYEIVVYDSLLKHLPEEKHVTAVIKHEIGHVKMRHLIYKAVLLNIQWIFIVLLMTFFANYRKSWLPYFGVTYDSIYLSLFIVQRFAEFIINYFFLVILSIMTRR